MKEDKKRERIVERAKKLGKEAERKYMGCSQSSFSAICQAFREEGMELFTPGEEEKIFKGMVGLEGGTAAEGIGTCGAVIGPAFIVSYLSGIGRKEQEENIYSMAKSVTDVQEGITSKWLKAFGSIRCNDICLCRWGKVLSFKNTDTAMEFLKLRETRPECQDTRCTIAIGAGFGAEAVCDLLKIE